MKVKFLRNYGKYKIGEETVITVDDKEKEYLTKTNTIKIIEEDETPEASEIPEIDVEKDGGKNEKAKGRNKK